jgi:putative glutamine amidotransferase
MICVQWHPERIKNKEQNPFSKNIRDWFLLEAQKYSG